MALQRQPCPARPGSDNGTRQGSSTGDSALQPTATTLRIGVSACLLGQEVRFDGGRKHDRWLSGTLATWCELVPVCPEIEVGMGTPRESVRLEGDADAPRMVAPRSGVDWTAPMNDLSRRRARELAAADLDGFVLKKNSPSCGLFRVKVYPDRGMPARGGRGLFAAALVAACPLLPVEEEGRLTDPRLREKARRAHLRPIAGPGRCSADAGPVAPSWPSTVARNTC